VIAADGKLYLISLPSALVPPLKSPMGLWGIWTTKDGWYTQQAEESSTGASSASLSWSCYLAV
jgi:hypothetical protein